MLIIVHVHGIHEKNDITSIVAQWW